MKRLLVNRKRNYVTLAQGANALLVLILGKLIAVYVAPGDFGIYSLQFAAYTFILTFWVHPYLQFAKATNKTLLPRIGSRPYFLLLSCVVGIALLVLLGLMYFIFGMELSWLYILIPGFLVLSAVHRLVVDYLKVDNQLITASGMEVWKAFAGLGIALLIFVVGMDLENDVENLWGIQFGGVALGLIYFLSKYRAYAVKFPVSVKPFVRKYFRFAGPLMFLAIWSWCNNYFDRYAIEYFLSEKEVGIYNANYGVGSKYFLVLYPIFTTLLTPSVFGLRKVKDKKRTIFKYSLAYVVFGLVSLFLIYIFREPIGYLLLSDAYSDGFDLIFWIALAYFFLTLAYIYESILYAEERSMSILIGTVLSALTNIGLNVILIPYYGIWGAAIASGIGFTVHLGYIFYRFKRL